MSTSRALANLPLYKLLRKYFPLFSYRNFPHDARAIRRRDRAVVGSEKRRSFCILSLVTTFSAGNAYLNL